METHRIWEGYSHIVCIVLTVFLIVGLFGSDVFATRHDSLLNQPSTTIAAPPVILQSGSVGTSTIYANNTSAMVNVAAPEYQYVTITLTDSQTSATPNPFQEMITWNPSSYTSYEASNLGNIRFYSDSALTTPLYAWLESCTPSLSNTATNATAWIKLTSPIAANGGTLTIYMAFLSTATSFDGNYWGDAPNLSGTYGVYDNGVNVFNAYFNGNTATSSFSVYTGDTLVQVAGISGPGGATINAIRVTGSTGGHYPAFSFNKATSNTALIAESSFSLTNTGAATGAVGLVDNAIATSIQNGITAQMGYTSSYFSQAYEVAGAVTLAAKGYSGTSTTNWVYASVTYPGSAASSWSAYIAPQLYSSTGGYSGTVSNNPLSSATNIYLGQISGSSAINVSYNFVRARAYPPSNIMPSVSFGVPSYVLSFVNQVTNAWNVSLQVYGSSNIARLSSATISFYGGTSSNQIVINGGSIVQSQGALYNLLGGSGTTIYVSISNLLANATGVSYLYVYLEILTPNTTTFLLYAITFVIT